MRPLKKYVQHATKKLKLYGQTTLVWENYGSTLTDGQKKIIINH